MKAYSTPKAVASHNQAPRHKPGTRQALREVFSAELKVGVDNSEMGRKPNSIDRGLQTTALSKTKNCVLQFPGNI